MNKSRSRYHSHQIKSKLKLRGLAGVTFLLLLTLFSRGILAQNTVSSQDYEAFLKSSSYSADLNEKVKEGFEALDQNNAEASAQILMKAVEGGVKHPLVSFKLALGYEALGIYYSAIQNYETAKEQFQSSNKSHRYRNELDAHLGRAYFMMGQEERGLKLLEQATKNNKYPWALKFLGQYFLNKGDQLMASAYFERFLKANANSYAIDEQVEVLTQLARLYNSKGEKEGAKKYYEQITKLDPQNAEAKQFLGTSSAGSGVKSDDHTNKILELLEKH